MQEVNLYNSLIESNRVTKFVAPLAYERLEAKFKKEGNRLVKVNGKKVPLLDEDGNRVKKAKRYYLNMNNYRNWHHFLEGAIKKWYTAEMQKQMSEDIFFKNVKCYLFYFVPNKKKRDRNNVLIIHDKYFMDALTTFGCMEDDNDNFVHSTSFHAGGMDKEHPRVEIFIEELAN